LGYESGLLLRLVGLLSTRFLALQSSVGSCGLQQHFVAVVAAVVGGRGDVERSWIVDAQKERVRRERTCPLGRLTGKKKPSRSYKMTKNDIPCFTMTR